MKQISDVHVKLAPLLREEDRRKRAESLVPLIKTPPDVRWWNEEVFEVLRSCGLDAWPVIEPLLFEEKHLWLHAKLIQLGYDVARHRTRETMLRIVAEERAWWKDLAASGKKWGEDEPPYSYHRHRQSAAQWALDSMQ